VVPIPRISPKVWASFKDSALLKTFGKPELACSPPPSAIEKEVREATTKSVVGHPIG